MIALKRVFQRKWNLDQFVEGASQRRSYQPTSERYERQLQDIQSKTSTVESGEKWQRKEKKKIKKYCNNCSKVGLHPPGRNYQPWTRVWKGAAGSTTMLHVSEQDQFHMYSRRNLKSRYTGNEYQENNRGWRVKQWLRQRKNTLGRQHNMFYTNWRRLDQVQVKTP